MVCHLLPFAQSRADYWWIILMICIVGQVFFFLMGDVSNLFFPQKCLPVTPAFVMSVRDAFENQRPAKRQKKVLDQHQKFVLSQPNFCFLEKNCGTLKREAITLEIKVRKTYLITSKNIIILCYLLCFPSDEWKMWSYKERFTWKLFLILFTTYNIDFGTVL